MHITFEEFETVMIHDELRHQIFKWKNACLKKGTGSWSYNYFVPCIISTNKKYEECPNF